MTTPYSPALANAGSCGVEDETQFKGDANEGGHHWIKKPKAARAMRSARSVLKKFCMMMP
jgi:hypothetical protein